MKELLIASYEGKKLRKRFVLRRMDNTPVLTLPMSTLSYTHSMIDENGNRTVLTQREQCPRVFIERLFKRGKIQCLRNEEVLHGSLWIADLTVDENFRWKISSMKKKK